VARFPAVHRLQRLNLPLRDAENRPRHQAKPDMTDSGELSANAYELLIQGVVDYANYMLDQTGRVMSWNPGAERIKGHTAAEVVGEHFSRFYTDEDRAAGAPEQALKIAAESGRFTTEAWRRRRLPQRQLHRARREGRVLRHLGDFTRGVYHSRKRFALRHLIQN
jgi:PAS domain-containing protein